MIEATVPELQQEAFLGQLALGRVLLKILLDLTM
jgi:hypothetical protein